MPRRPRPAIDRLTAKLVERDGCWVFTGALSQGYGVIGAGPRGSGNVLAHRLTYDFYVGAIPEGLDLDHLCRNRACCNPWHLDPVTRRVNVARGLLSAEERAKRRDNRTHCAAGHPTAENQSVTKRRNGMVARRCLACARDQYHAKKAGSTA